uniref:Putative secreted peptide n=1 Tax=Anopheles braziliensis TaxID=58242 RepID=A0A2M3ZWZ4_9DIPT
MIRRRRRRPGMVLKGLLLCCAAVALIMHLRTQPAADASTSDGHADCCQCCRLPQLADPEKDVHHGRDRQPLWKG